MLDKIYNPEYEFKKVGVTLANLQDYEHHQFTLFNDEDDPKRISLMKVMDQINKKYNHDTIRSAACGVGNGNFEAERPMMSPSFCTKWSEILSVDSIIGFTKKGN